MWRRDSSARGFLPGPRPSHDPAPAETTVTVDESTGAGTPASPRVASRRITLRRAAFASLLVFAVAGGAAYTQRSAFSAQAADLSRRAIGDENTARLESYYFRIEDRAHRLKYQVLGGSDDPFAAKVRVEFIPDPPAPVIPVRLRADPPPVTMEAIAGTFINGSIVSPFETLIWSPPQPMTFPVTKPLRETLDAGEGAWTTTGLPRSTPTDPLMAKTFIRPDKTRPYANVGVLLVDSRRVKLSIRGGTKDPGGHRGVPGSGVIPAAEQSTLLAAFNGGFKGPHGGFGMVADGKEYMPLRSGLASIAVLKNGEIRMGEWGKDITWSDEMVAVRQNAVPLVSNCELGSRVREGNDTWGYVNVDSSEFITWRSAVGLTKDGNLLIASGNSQSAETLARAMWAAGACFAMQLDINSPYVLTSIFWPQADGTVKAEKFMDSMPDNPARFLKTNERDFFYVTLDETRYYR